MGTQPNPDERFKDVESTLENLSNSFRHLLTAQVIMNDWQQRTQTLIEKLAEQTLKQAEQGTLTEQRLDRLSEKVESLIDGQKHTDAKLDALTDIVRQLVERNGNGGGQRPS